MAHDDHGEKDEKDNALRAELRGLADTTPPPRVGFSDAVMHRIALQPRPRRSFWRSLVAPRSFTIRFSLAQLAGCAAAVALVSAFGLRSLRPLHDAPVHVAAVEPGPTAGGEVLVRFALPAKDAHTVSVAGDFNGWRPDATPLKRDADGVFRGVVPLLPGTWSYSFVVDGNWVEDPFAESYRADGFGGRNALLHIGG